MTSLLFQDSVNLLNNNKNRHVAQDFLGGPVVKDFHASTKGCMGSIPGQRTKILCA